MRSLLSLRFVNVKVLRFSFFPLTALLALTFLFAIFMAYWTGWDYNTEVSREGFISVARSLGAVLGAGILAAAVVTQSLKARTDQIEQRLLAWLDKQGEPTPEIWNQGVEMALEETASAMTVGPQGPEILASLVERNHLASVRKYSSRLFSVTIAFLMVLVAVALWAIPATEMFLRISQPTLNTAIVLLTSYGTIAAVGALVAAMILAIKE